MPALSAPLAAAADIFTDLAGELPTLLTEGVRGRVEELRGFTVAARGLPVPIGARCLIRTRAGLDTPAEVTGLVGGKALLTVFGESTGIAPGDPVLCTTGAPRVPVGFGLLGRVIDAEGRPRDGRAAPRLMLRYPLYADAPPALHRAPVEAPLGLGIRAIDALLTAGRGQRLGIFAGTGVGKSSLLGMICRHTQADVVVVALVGERGKEVGDFVRKHLGAEGLARAVVVACTSDEAAPLRVRACLHATAVAEFFRDQGLDVLLLVDSVTRMAMAQRQIGLAAGEPPTARGYPPSAFALLPRVLERAGRTQRGSITGIYTVLVEGGDIDEPLADAVRGILDGHIWLSRDLANAGHYPAIDVLGSVSRVAPDVTPPQQQRDALAVRRMLAAWRDIEDLVNIGAYAAGASPVNDAAVRTRDAVLRLLRQDGTTHITLPDAAAALRELAATIDAAVAEPRPRGTGKQP